MDCCTGCPCSPPGQLAHCHAHCTARQIAGTRLHHVLVGSLFARDKRLCYALLWMGYWDQAARRPWALYAPWWRHWVDRRHARRLAGIIARGGWPSVSCVGPPGTDAAWLLAQHADHDPAFQRRCLALLEDAVRRREAPPRYLAYLTDRVLVAEGRPQAYGTQFR